jgi:hypothetical protein
MPSRRRTRRDGLVQVETGELFDRETIREVAKDRNFFEQLSAELPISNRLLPKRLSESEIRRSVDYALRRLPKYLKVSKRRLPSPGEASDLRIELTNFLRQQFSSPKLDGELILQNCEFAGLRVSKLGSAAFLTVHGKVDLILRQEKERGKEVKEDDTEGEESSFIKNLPVIADFTLELLGLVLGLAGLSVPKQKGLLKQPLARLVREKGFRAAFLRLIRALKRRNWKAIIEFLRYLEEGDYLLNLLSVIFDSLKWYDYALAIGKVIAWIVAATSSGGTALALKLLDLGLDIAQLLLKLGREFGII